MYRLQTTTTLPAALDEVFGFFSKAENLQRITPDSLQFKILTPGPLQMREGLLIDYRIKINGIPQRWRTRIARWDPPHAFIDEQLKGPYNKWVHLHQFRPVEGGTEMLDQVDYQLPLQPLGRLVHPIIKRQLRTIFNHRAKVIHGYVCPGREQEVSLGEITFTKLSQRNKDI